MEEKIFNETIKEKLSKINITIHQEQIEKFYEYMKLLIEWNEKINLTAIIEPQDIILKHFVDSLTIQRLIENTSSILDVGTGAGFPGIPLKIMLKDSQVTLLDSLNKRVQYLEEVIQKLQLKKIETIHSRAEELAHNKQHREQYDVVTSRAVASLSTLVEYMLPYTKIGGLCICMKGSSLEEELEKSRKAIELLGGTIEKIEKFELPDTDMRRNIVVIRKTKETPKQYPRKAGTPAKDPIE